MLRRDALSTAAGTQNVENWAVNKAVHYNEWANFGRKDFEPVVAAFKELLECFQCKNYESWLDVTPRGSPESLRCTCNAISFNLKAKPLTHSAALPPVLHASPRPWHHVKLAGKACRHPNRHARHFSPR